MNKKRVIIFQLINKKIIYKRIEFITMQFSFLKLLVFKILLIKVKKSLRIFWMSWNLDLENYLLVF